jgi:hypothetical protein
MAIAERGSRSRVVNRLLTLLNNNLPVVKKCLSLVQQAHPTPGARGVADRKDIKNTTPYHDKLRLCGSALHRLQRLQHHIGGQ